MVGAVLTTMAITATSDIPIAILTLITANLQITSMSVAEKISTAVFTRPAPILLLALSCFYLWVYLRSSSGLYSLSQKSSPC